MESRENILLGLRSGGVLFVEGGIGTKIPSEYFSGTRIGVKKPGPAGLYHIGGLKV
jgi:hypothetical protein